MNSVYRERFPKVGVSVWVWRGGVVCVLLDNKLWEDYKIKSVRKFD